MESLIALDVDGVLNGAEDHLYIETIESAEGLSDEELPARLKGILEFYKPETYGWGDWINVIRTDQVRSLVLEHSAHVVGTSSWFTTNERKDISEFFEIDIQYVNGCTGGGWGRCRALAEFVLEHKPKHLLILDDQWFDWDLFGLEEYRIKKMNGIKEHQIPEGREILSKIVDYDKIAKAYVNAVAERKRETV